MKNGLEIDEFGNKRYYLNGKYHRDDGPAVEHTDGDKWWYQHDYLHRLDGPAVEYYDGYKEWYFHGKEIDCFSLKKSLKKPLN
jgi:hypothetical protein